MSATRRFKGRSAETNLFIPIRKGQLEFLRYTMRKKSSENSTLTRHWIYNRRRVKKANNLTNIHCKAENGREV